jgi:hypothetical protein
MDIGGKLREIESIEKELSLMRERRAALARRRDELMASLVAFHRERGTDSFEYKGKKYYLKEKATATRKTKEQRDRDVSRALEKQGLYGNDAQRVYETIVEQLRGAPKTTTTVVGSGGGGA